MKTDEMLRGLGGGAVITGMAFHTGDLVISAEEKAKTVVKDSEKAKIEAEKIRKGLGIVSNSVANVGENARSAAAIAVVKYALAYEVNLNDVENFLYNTESPKGISANDARAIIKLVNRLSMELLESGINIGTLRNVHRGGSIEEVTHSQSACVAAVANLTRIARAGSVSGKTLLVTGEKSNYKYGTAPDETGSFGATVVAVERVGSGLRISRHTGASGDDIPDFDKPILELPGDEKSGIANISKYPIVFGKYSSYPKMRQSFMSMKIALDRAGIDFDDPKFFEKNIIVSHIPYPAMAEKELANLMVHFMHRNPDMNSRVMAEAHEAIARDPKLKAVFGDNPAVPYIDGFNSQMESFRFVEEVCGLVLRLQQKKDLQTLAKKGIAESNAKHMAAFLINEIKPFREKYNISKDAELDLLFGQTEERLQRIRINGGTLEDLIGAFAELYEPVEGKSNAYINKYMDREALFNKVLRQTPSFKKLREESLLGETLKLPARTGNIYTGSAFLALMSLLASTRSEEIRDKNIILVGYGSGAESYTVILEPENVHALQITAKAMVESDQKTKTEISAIEYKRTRFSGNLDEFVGKMPIAMDCLDGLGGFVTNKNETASYFRRFIQSVKSEMNQREREKVHS